MKRFIFNFLDWLIPIILLFWGPGIELQNQGQNVFFLPLGFIVLYFFGSIIVVLSLPVEMELPMGQISFRVFLWPVAGFYDNIKDAISLFKGKKK